MGRMKNTAIELAEKLAGMDTSADEFDAAMLAVMSGKATESTVEADEWTLRADELAFAAESLLNRSDACGGYRPSHPTTRKSSNSDWLPMDESLYCHFTGQRVVGLHSTATDNTCRWIAFDIDAHNGESADDNLESAQLIASRLRERGLKPYLFDSDGRGGIHVWCVLPKPIPSPAAYVLAREVAFEVDVECFPKQPEIREGGYGNWIRLPGKHHKRDHWSRVWTEIGWGDDTATIDAIVEMCR